MIAPYPSTLPGPQPGAYELPLRRAASSLPGPLQQRSRQYDLSGGIRTHTFIYTAPQMAAWREWYRDTLLQGRRWFKLSLPGYGGMTLRTVRYLEHSQSLIGVGVYAIEARFELREANAVEPVAPPGDALFGFVHSLMMPLDATSPMINYAPAGGTFTLTGTDPPIPFATGGPFAGVGYVQRASATGNPTWVGPLLGAQVDSWAFDCHVNYLGTTHTRDAGLLRLPNNIQLNLDTSTSDGDNGELRLSLSGIPTWDSAVLSTGWRHIQLESKLVSSTRRLRIWIDGVLRMDGVALGITSPNWAVDTGTRAGINSGAGFANIPFPISCWRFTKDANRNWDDATFTPPSTLAEYFD